MECNLKILSFFTNCTLFYIRNGLLIKISVSPLIPSLLIHNQTYLIFFEFIKHFNVFIYHNRSSFCRVISLIAQINQVGNQTTFLFLLFFFIGQKVQVGNCGIRFICFFFLFACIQS